MASTLLQAVAASMLAGTFATSAVQADATRSFATEIGCSKATGLGPGVCQRLFTAARAEFEAKTRSYPNRSACYRAYGPCMPWPPGPAPIAHFRPQWMGATAVGPTASLTALPVVAPGRIALLFKPHPLGDATSVATAPEAGSLAATTSGPVPERLCREIAVTAGKAGLPPGFLARLLWQESSFRPDVISPAGALGIAQFMPTTAQERGLVDPFDATRAIEASARLLGDLARRFGNLGLAAAAYNGGPARVSDWLNGRGSLAAETRAYVQSITGRPVEDWAAGDVAPPYILAAPCRFDRLTGASGS